MATDDPQQAHLHRLKDSIVARGHLQEAEVDEDFVRGAVDFPALEATMLVNVDPELDERDWAQVEPRQLAEMLDRLVAQTDQDWSDIGDAVVDVLFDDDEIDDGDIDQDQLRDDLELIGVIIMHQAVVLSFAAQEVLPETLIYVQLDEDMDVEAALLDDGSDDDDPAADPAEWRDAL